MREEIVKKEFTHLRLISRSKLLVIAISIILMSGCTQNSHKHPNDRPEPKETFSTKATSNGTKLFSYSVEIPERSRTRGGERRQRSGMAKRKQRSGTEKRERRAESGAAGRGLSTERLHEQLEQKIAETGFCKEGYVVLDEVFRNRFASIRGECRDGADE